MIEPCARDQLVERRGDARHACFELVDGILQIQPQRGEHLVVARAAEMHALAGLADARDQQILQRRLPVLVLELHVAIRRAHARRRSRSDLAIAARSCGGQQPLSVEHFRVRDRCAHVVGDEPIVERVILAGRVAQDALVERSPCPTGGSCSARAAPPATER